MIRKIIFLAGFTAGLFLLYSCDQQRVFEQNTRIPDGRWHKDQVVRFGIQMDDTLSSHNIYLNIRNTGKYDFSNLFVFITTYAPNGQFVRDTFECMLADEKGKWFGRGLGDLYFVQTPYRLSVAFPYRGLYTFEIEQAMRTEVLPHITDIGIRIEKVEY